MPAPASAPFLGVDLGATNVVAGVVDPTGRVVSRAKKKIGGDPSPDAVLARVLATIREALDEAGLPPEGVAAVGVGAPGPVDPLRGVVLRAPNLGWRDVPLAALVTEALGRPCFVDNDVNVGTLAEHLLGAGRGFDDLMGIFVGTGIGAGLVLNVRLYHGHAFTAGEIGHTLLHADLPRGRRTLENCASRTAIGFWLQQLVDASHPSALTGLVEGGDLRQVRSKALAKALDQKDPVAVEVVQRAATYVGIAIANAVTMLSLPCVVVGGGVTEALRRPWMTWIRRAFAEAVFPSELAACRIVAARLGDDAGMVGAALVARDRAARHRR